MKKFLFYMIYIAFCLCLYGCSKSTDTPPISATPISNLDIKNSLCINGDDNIDRNMIYNTNFNNSSLYTMKYSKNIKPIFQSDGYKNMTSKSQMYCYNALIKNCTKISSTPSERGYYPIEEITLSNCKINSNDLKKVLCAVKFDRPDIFWISNAFSISYFNNDTHIKFYSIISPSDYIIYNQKFQKCVSDIINTVDKNKSEYEIELYIHDWLKQNCKYEKNTPSWLNFTSYGAIVEKRAVCEGYSKAFQLLLCSLGINCRTINGTSKNQPHMWNIAQISGRWYHVDVTWDASDSLSSYNYFNVPTNVINHDHSVSPIFTERINSNINYNFAFPECNSLNDNYIIKNSVHIDSLENDNLIISKLIEISKQKQPYLYIKIKDNLNYDNTIQQLFLSSPYKFMHYINKANSYNIKNKIDKKVYFSKNNSLKAINIQISYI